MSESIGEYRIDKKWIVWSCPQCNAELRSPLQEAGTRQSCPQCKTELLTPGAKELGRIRAEEARQRAREEAQRQQEAAATQAPAVVAYAPPAAKPVQSPDYKAITTGAFVLGLAAAVYLVLGAAAFLFGLAMIINGMTGGASGNLPDGAGLAVSGLIALCVGAVIRMIGAVGLAVRDIARNSFRQ